MRAIRLAATALVLTLIGCRAAEREAVEEEVPETAVELSEWSIAIAETGPAAGLRTLVVRNTGQYTHALEIESDGNRWRTENIPPDGEDRLPVDLLPGTYTVYCPIVDEHGDHADRGMVTRLVVP